MHRDNRLTFYNRLGGDACWYCGIAAECLDHAFPVSIDVALAPKGMLLLVPACNECNHIAFDNVHRTLSERRLYIQECLKKKYKKLLSIPQWTDRELSTLKGRLQQSVLNSVEEQRRMTLRVRYRGHTLEYGDEL